MRWRRAIGGLLALGAASAAVWWVTRPTRPNLVLIVWDTTRADHLGPWGYARPTTPTLDRIAEEAVVYEHARSPSPWTLPSHTSMFTGLLPGEHHATWAAYPHSTRRVPPPVDRSRFLAKRLQEAGYLTVGVTSNPWVSRTTAMDEGFTWFQRSFGKQAPDGDGAADRAWRTFERALEDPGLSPPFFAFFNFIDPHQPYDAPNPERFDGDPRVMRRLQFRGPDVERRLLAGAGTLDAGRVDGLYDAEIRFVDDQLAKVEDWLRDAGLWDDTLLIVTSDHGDHLGERGRWSHQLSVDEELLHVPLLVKWPRGWGAGTRVSDRTVSTLDVYATLLAAAGIHGDHGRSRDLAAAGPAPWAISEYFWSDAMLGTLVKLNPAFPLAEHQVVRRVIATPDVRVELAGDDVVDVRSWSGDPVDPEVADTALGVLRAYVDGLDAPRTATEDVEDDADDVQMLKELGYAE